MTEYQICALIVFILLVGIVFYAGYRNGLNDGRATGVEEGKAIEHADSAESLRGLQLDQARDHYKSLYSPYERATAAANLGAPERQTLLDAGETLRIAAKTFSAFRTGKKLEKDARAHREKLLELAAMLPADQEKAA
ncbi:hypothetical protein M1B34_17815 [Pseudomonas sp. MAFF 302030]|uniref:Uncharacterized protein n=1 Tax=Pseudomonas morbosilactucae TaxID=2938197 RepID=A0A9X1YXN8_9PSED|nr:hypothetical protein [Pseudomonas morbosilactucae]MCK9799511.1 hypothetical protein [Pseudomonas morbosilactucae]